MIKKKYSDYDQSLICLIFYQKFTFSSQFIVRHMKIKKPQVHFSIKIFSIKNKNELKAFLFPCDELVSACENSQRHTQKPGYKTIAAYNHTA